MERVYVVLGATAWLLALGIGLLMQTVTITQEVAEPLRGQVDRSISAVAPNPVSGTLAGGFAVAGGLCFVAAALASRGGSVSAVKPLGAEQAKRDIDASIAALEGSSGPRS